MRFWLSFLVAFLIAGSAAAQSPIRPGDRIAIIGNTFADQLRTHGYLETLLLEHTRENPVSVRNLGWGGDMLDARDRPTGFPTEESTLTAHKTDVIIACFGMGESFSGEAGLDEFKSRFKALIDSHAGKKYNGKSEVRLVLVSPIACEDLGKLTPAHDKRNRELRAYAQALREVASDTDMPFVDLFEPSRYLMDEAVGPNLTNNGIHLNPYGYWAISRAFFAQLAAGDQLLNQTPWTLQIDVEAESGKGRGVGISDLATDGTGLSFRVTEKSAPTLRPPTDQPLPPQLESARDRLAVKNLKPGKYQLTIDGDSGVTATAEAWSRGVAIDSSPTHKAAEAYRAAVRDKNLQFVYSWKALNQVHIVGERKSSPSGRELPKEVIAFNALAKQRELALRDGFKLKARHWRLERVAEKSE